MSSLFQQVDECSSIASQLAMHGEAISVTPAGEAAVSIMAIVDRGPMQPLGPDGVMRHEYDIAIRVARQDYPCDPRTGEVIALKRRIGDAANTNYSVGQLLEQDGGSFLFGLRGA